MSPEVPILALGLGTAVGILAWVVARRGTGVGAGPAWPVPTQLERADFGEQSSPWLVAVFTSESCESCAAAIDAAQRAVRPGVAVVEIDLERGAPLHHRYGIDAVPSVLIADRAGLVRGSFAGPPAVAELTELFDELGV